MPGVGISTKSGVVSLHVVPRLCASFRAGQEVRSEAAIVHFGAVGYTEASNLKSELQEKVSSITAVGSGRKVATHLGSN